MKRTHTEIARDHLDAIDRDTNEGSGVAVDHYYLVLGLAGIGYALLDVADAVRAHTRAVKGVKRPGDTP